MHQRHQTAAMKGKVTYVMAINTVVDGTVIVGTAVLVGIAGIANWI